MSSVAVRAEAGATELLRAYDEGELMLTTVGAQAAVAYLVAELNGIRSRLAVQEWRAAVANTRRHHLLVMLREDPYAAQAFAKPRGYSGDAYTLDFVYGYRELDAATTRQGRELHCVSTTAAIAVAVRDRCDHVAATIAEVAGQIPCAVIASVACGHMRELHRVPEHLTGEITFVGLDQDGVSLAALARLHPGLRVTALETSVRALITGRAILPRADLVYASGLFDYVERGVAISLCARLFAVLQPGGLLLIPNLTPANHEAAYMEAVMDWWMIYRDEGEMRELGMTLASDGVPVQFGTYTTSGGRVTWLRAQRI